MMIQTQLKQGPPKGYGRHSPEVKKYFGHNPKPSDKLPVEVCPAKHLANNAASDGSNKAKEKRPRYPRSRIDAVLAEVELPISYRIVPARIVPARYLPSPLGAAPANSRFCTQDSGFIILYAAPTSPVLSVIKSNSRIKLQKNGVTCLDLLAILFDMCYN